MQVPAGPKGTRDFYPEDMAVRERIFSSWHRTCRRYGFEPYDGPQFEHLELYTRKSGDEIEKQLYNFLDKGGRAVALRPEMTPTLARMVAAKGTSLKRPVRWYSIPRLFRYERTQKGRLREFFQLNMDILGIADVCADAELIAAVIDTMRDLGCDEGDFTVCVSSRTLLEEAFTSFGVASESLPGLYALLDRKAKVPENEFYADLGALAREETARKKIADLLNGKTLDDIGQAAGSLASYETLTRLFALMDTYGFRAYTGFDIGIVRGLAYYTGIVFEVFDKRRSMRAIAGGGRYDGLVKMCGGPDTPAVGFAAGDVVLGELLAEKGGPAPQPPRSDVFVVTFEETGPEGAIRVTQRLRAAGIPAEFSLRKTGVGKQMAQADAARARAVVFCGGDEEKQGLLKVKDMRAGEEKLVQADRLVETVRELLSR